MQERILPFKTYAWEKDVIEYSGTLLYVLEGHPEPVLVAKQYTSPGVTVYLVDVGQYVIYLDDKVPVWDNVLNGVPSAQDLTAIDQGFGSNYQCFVQLRSNSAITDICHIQCSTAYFVTPGEKQIAFKVFTYNGASLTDMPWSFKITISGQPAKLVNGQGV